MYHKRMQCFKWIAGLSAVSALVFGGGLSARAAEPAPEEAAQVLQMEENAGQDILEDAALMPEVDVQELQALQLEMLTESIIDSVTTPEMTDGEKLVVCYQYILDTCSYKRSYGTPEGDWTKEYAIELLTTGQGNCYRYASGLASLARAIGYDVKVVTGEIGTSKGGMTPHGWTEVLIGDTWYVFDAVRQDASKRRNYFGQTYETYPGKPIVKQAEWELDF